MRAGAGAGPDAPPSGDWRLVISPVGWQVYDTSGGGGLYDVAYLAPGLAEIRTGMATGHQHRSQRLVQQRARHAGARPVDGHRRKAPVRLPSRRPSHVHRHCRRRLRNLPRAPQRDPSRHLDPDRQMSEESPMRRLRRTVLGLSAAVALTGGAAPLGAIPADAISKIGGFGHMPLLSTDS